MIDTARALSSASPTLPIDADSPCSVRDSVNLTDVYLLPALTSAVRHRRSTTGFADAVEAIAHRAAVNFVAYPVGVPRAQRRSHPHRSGPGPVPPPITAMDSICDHPYGNQPRRRQRSRTHRQARRPRSVRLRAGNKSGQWGDYQGSDRTCTSCSRNDRYSVSSQFPTNLPGQYA
jgi:hypothetical protein